MKKITLTRLANNLFLDKGTDKKPHPYRNGPRLGYTPLYEKHFEPIRDKELSLLEIGIENGSSLRMWYAYFKKASIYGADILSKKHIDNKRIKTFIANQASKSSLERLSYQLPLMDIIIDDGSHIVSHQQRTLEVLFPKLKNGGMYWIEDLCTSDESVWDGKRLYGYDTSFEPGQSTVNFLERIKRGEYRSDFISEKGLKYLKDNIDSCTIYDLPKTEYGYTKLCVIKKK